MRIQNYLLLFILFGSLLYSNSLDLLKELDIGARASVAYDSNIFGVSEKVYQIANRANEEVESSDDFILNFSPSVHFSKKVYLLSIGGSAGVSMTRYIKNEDKSYIVPVTTLSLDFDESLKKRLSTNAKIRFDATFDLGQHVDTSIADQDLVSYTYFTASLNARYNHSTKFGCCCENFRLSFGIQIDCFRIAATFKIECSSIRPTMFIITN